MVRTTAAAACLVALVARPCVAGEVVGWFIGEAGETCTTTCGRLGGTCTDHQSFWPKDSLSMARVAMSTKTKCINIKKLDGQDYVPAFAPSTSFSVSTPDTCFYSSQGSSRDACNEGPHTMEVAGRQPFCPCATPSRLYDDMVPSLLAAQAAVSPSFLAMLLVAVAVGGSVGGVVTWRLVSTRHGAAAGGQGLGSYAVSE